MELGEKIKQARLEAGLSQRQLCGERITRNMLSQIEHGTAKPSMDTLRLLAAGLGKPVSYFLEEHAVTSPNLEVMEQGRTAYREGNPQNALDILTGYREPDPVFDQEVYLLRSLCRMAVAERAVAENRFPYARTLLAQTREDGMRSVYFTEDLERRRLLILAQAAPEDAVAVAKELPADDRELILRAEAALAEGDPARAEELLNAAHSRETAQWQFLRAECCFALGAYARAAEGYLQAESEYPRQTAQRLEICYRELGDYRRAYEYACKQKG